MTTIRLATTDAEIEACFEVMHALRPHIPADAFVERIRAQQSGGYQLAALWDGEPVAVAGFRLGTNLAWGRYLYVDDLVTLPSRRSRGHGAELLRWLRDLAESERCHELHLDSGTQRTDAHRFYDREGMDMTSHHYVWTLRPQA